MSSRGPKGRGDLIVHRIELDEIATLHSQRRLDCGNPKNSFARIRCRDCGKEFLLHFSWGKVSYQYGKSRAEEEQPNALLIPESSSRNF